MRTRDKWWIEEFHPATLAGYFWLTDLDPFLGRPNKSLKLSNANMNGRLSVVNGAGRIHLGTSGFTAPGWQGSFYPTRMKPADFLGFYAEHFSTVEVDSTFYGTPSPHVVSARQVHFSVKIPQIITHEKLLADCDAELKQFIDTQSCPN
jgi:Protein of unknown function DUF72